VTSTRPIRGSDATGGSPPRAFRAASRRRNRIAAGAALASIAIGGNLLIYTSLDSARPVIQVVRDVPAGEQITVDMLRTVDVDADSTVNLIDGAQLGSLVGTYARVRLVSGSLVTFEALQTTPLVAAGASVVAVQVADGALPIGVRERVPVLLVIPPDRTSDTDVIVSIPGRVVGLPTATTSALGLQSLSVEVASGDAATVAAADDVRVALLEPTADGAAVASARPHGA